MMEYRQCKICGEVKPLTEYHASTGNVGGYRIQCKLCRNAMSKKYRTAEYFNNYYHSNKARCKAIHKRYRSSEQGKLLSYIRTGIRVAKKRAAQPVWANEAYIKLWYVLAKEEAVRTGRGVHVDHIVPLQSDKVCGLHCEHNLQLLYAEDNLRKRNVLWPDMA